MSAMPAIQIVDALEFQFRGTPVAAVRMTQGSKWCDKAQNYLGYQQALANALRLAFPEWIVGEPPATLYPKERKAWIKEQKRFYYRLGVYAYVEADRGDWDNFYKSAADALQLAKLIWNDRLIEWSLGGWRRIDKDNPRIEISFEKVLR